MNNIETVRQLWERHREFIPDDAYPSGVVPVCKALSGSAFFPGGYGLYDSEGRVDPDKRLRELPVLILGQDYHNEETYKKRLRECLKNPRGKTRDNLLALMREVDFKELNLCLFSNVYMGLRKGNAKPTDDFPGARDPDFVRLCREFLRLHIQAQHPRLILTLGKPAARMLATSEDKSGKLAAWRRAKTYSDLNDDNALIRSVTFADTTVSAVAALIHPCMFNSNKRHRHYRGKKSEEAEKLIVRDAIKTAGLSGS